MGEASKREAGTVTMRAPLLLSLLVACATPATAPGRTTPTPGAGATAPPPAAVPPVLKIATFNIKVFGPTKASHEAVVAEIAAIIAGYDVIAIQEIKDSSGEAPRTSDTPAGGQSR
jgi:hypothetical protein